MPETQARYSDAAKRIHNSMVLHAIAKSEGFCAYRLSDGKPVDNTCYPTHAAAVRACKWNRDEYIYLEVQADGGTLEGCEAALTFARQLHAAGYRIPDPSAPFNTAMPLQAWDRRSMIRHLASGGRF